MLGTSHFIAMAMLIVFGVALPVGVCAWWLPKHREKITTVLIGAAVWFVFAMVVEQIVKAVLFSPALPTGKALLASPAAAALTAALLAGIFEETGRLIAFQTILKKRKNRETAISYGIGHGGFEAMFLLVIAGVQDLAYAVMINTGIFPAIIQAAAKQGADTAALQALPEKLMTVTPVTSLLAAFERIFAMVMHVGLSILVFSGAKKSKPQLFILAVLLHALFDVPAALYQLGILPSLYAVEAITAVYAVGFFIVAYRLLYQKDHAKVQPESENKSPLE